MPVQSITTIVPETPIYKKFCVFRTVNSSLSNLPTAKGRHPGYVFLGQRKMKEDIRFSSKASITAFAIGINPKWCFSNRMDMTNNNVSREISGKKVQGYVLLNLFTQMTQNASQVSNKWRQTYLVKTLNSIINKNQPSPIFIFWGSTGKKLASSRVSQKLDILFNKNYSIYFYGNSAGVPIHASKSYGSFQTVNTGNKSLIW